MAGLPSHTKKKQSARSARSTNREGDGLPRIDMESANDLEASPTLQIGQNNTSLGTPPRNESSERNSSTQRETSAQSTKSTNSPPDLLWITTDKPADFKDAKIQRMISRHVMRDYQQKDQSKKESSRAMRNKNSAMSPSDDDASVVSSSTSQLSLTPMVNLGNVCYIPALIADCIIIDPRRKLEPETLQRARGPLPPDSSPRRLLRTCFTRWVLISVP